RRHGEPRRLGRGRDPDLAVGGLRLAVGQSGPGGHRLLCRADPDPTVSAHGALRPDPEMNFSAENAPHPRPLRASGEREGPAKRKGEGWSRARRTAVYWSGFAVILALLIIAPLVLPEFWRRFLTEILIWGLLAMSSDLLIGYTG